MGRSLPLIRWSLMTAGHVAVGVGGEALGGEVGVGGAAHVTQTGLKSAGGGGEYVWNSPLRNADSHETTRPETRRSCSFTTK